MKINLVKTTFKENKVIYIYHHPKSKEHEGWLKIGDQTGYNSGRVRDQNEADNIEAETLYTIPAIDKNGKPFRDKDVHAIIDASGLFEREQKKNSKSGRYSEWYKMTKKEAIEAIESRINLTGFNLDILKKTNVDIKPRDEQQKAIDQTYNYWKNKEINSDRKFLWNAKPRFGKTLTSYWFAEKIKAKKILIVTNRPTISDSWYEDYRKHIQPKGTYKFGSTKDNKYVTENGNLGGRALNVNEIKTAIKNDESVIFFISLQDVKGKDKNNPETFKQKNKWIFEESWDLFIIDESHEAIETVKAQTLFKNLKTDFELHLSGTPFKELANKKFKVQQIFNWTYEDEQSAKENWDPLDGENPYYELPRMNMFAYRLSKTLNAQIGDGEYAFDLNELFKVTQSRFVYEDKVLKFLDNLFGININNNQTKKPFPFADSEIRDELRHTFWLLPSVAAVKALKKLIQDQVKETPSRKIFADYEIIDAAAKGDDEHEGKTALEKVKKVIGDGIKTKSITLSCGQLTTGVTVKPWTAVLMLYGAEGGKTSATKYLQAAFRAQNPWKYTDEQSNERIKENCYVFDFAPDRLLLIFQDYAKSIIGGGEGTETKVKKLLNLLTVVAEDDYGEMKELDANEVVTMPLKLMTEEIVNGKFITSNKLFNIGNIFHLPDGAREILNEMGTISKGRIEHDKTKNKIEEPKLEYDSDGNLILNESNLGKKKYEELVKDNPDLPTDRSPIIDDLPPSDIKSELEKQVKDEQKELESEFHDHLRYFTRAIPMILMAYGKVDTKLENFEKYIDASTFQELVGITKEQFQDLRDKYELFNEDVFNASITEFLNRKTELANYYENNNDSDIFDYIPPQQTNQIYTPKSVVKMMVDNLEKYDPSIFKSKDNKFLDPYVKSGLFVTEIVKRLYKNLEHKIPDESQRLEHILTKQVYGFSPSKILHLISNETIFGFMHGRPEFKKVKYQVEKNFVYFENEEMVVSKNQNALNDKIKQEWGENMKFTAIIGNPPYQETLGKSETQTQGNSNWIYHYFQNIADKIGNYTCLIYPFGGWFDSPERLGGFGKKILSDGHTLSINAYEGTSDKRAWYRNDKNPLPIFGNGANLSAGVSIVLRDNTKNYLSFNYSNRMYTDIEASISIKDWRSLVPNPNFLQLAKKMEGIKLKERIIKGVFGIESNFVEKNPTMVSYKESDWTCPIRLLTNDKSGSAGRAKLFWTDKNIIKKGQKYINKYKVVTTSAYPKKTFVSGKPTVENVKLRTKELIEVLPKGSAFGSSKLSLFMSDNESDCKNFIKYTQTNFFAFLLLQEPNRRSTIGDVILDQDFTKKSDIDWSKSISEIDKQLYKKYNLSQEEIDFIETRVKPME